MPDLDPGPLSGVTVVDLSRVLAGPYCTMVLADLGARVIKVERPGAGDDARHMGPFIDGHSAYFASINRGKESIALDLLVEGDRAVFERLLDGADVLVENFRPGVLDRLGYGWESLASRWPGLILGSVSGFGQTGPYADRPAYDMVAQAMGGIMSITGPPGGEPARVGSSIGDLAAALFCAIGVVSALHERQVSGVARHVDVSMLDSQVALLENAIVRFEASGVVPGPLGARHPSITPFGVFRAGSGSRLVIAAGNDDIFGRLCLSLGVPALAADPRFTSNELRCRHGAELESLIESVLETRPAWDWLDVLGAAQVPCSPINDVAAVLADPQVAARRMVVTLTDSVLPGLRVAGNPIKLSGVADPLVRPGAPALDGDRPAILASLTGGIRRYVSPYYGPMLAEPVALRFTVEQYHQMSDAGLFPPDQRLELLDGEVIEMAAIGSRHAAAVKRLNRLFSFGDRAIIGVQDPVHVSDLSELQPDVTVLRWRPDFYENCHPTPDDVLLLIEVSDTTAAWDRSRKRPLYAAAGIAEMWIIDLSHNVIDVATDPGPEGYRQMRQVLPGSSITPLALPDLTLAVADLFG